MRSELVNGTAIRNLQNVTPLKTAFKYVFVLIGLRTDQLPNNEATQLLIDFTRRKFGNYTANEIIIAFEMAIAGDFKADTEHFGQFTPKYLANVLNAYSEHRNKIAKQLQEERSRKRKEQSEAEIQSKIDEFYGEAVDIYRNSSEVFEGSKYHANVLYETLKGHFTREELIAFKKEAGAELQKLKEESEALKVTRRPIPNYLKGLIFTNDEWRRRTALKVVNEALEKGVEL